MVPSSDIISKIDRANQTCRSENSKPSIQCTDNEKETLWDLPSTATNPIVKKDGGTPKNDLEYEICTAEVL